MTIATGMPMDLTIDGLIFDDNIYPTWPGRNYNNSE
jgi:hypothetical protein